MPTSGCLKRTCGAKSEEKDEYPQIPIRARRTIFVIGVLSLALVPVFQMLTGLPPFLGVLLGLVILWVYTDIMYSRLNQIDETDKLRISACAKHRPFYDILFSGDSDVCRSVGDFR